MTASGYTDPVVTHSIPKSAFLTKNVIWISDGNTTVTVDCADSLLNKDRSGGVNLLNTVSVYHTARLRSMTPKSTQVRANDF